MKLNVLITGATGNLGKVVVAKFLNEGHQVIAISSNERSLSELPERVKWYRADLTNELSTKETIVKITEDYKKIDVAILLAGGFAMGNMNNTSLVAIHEMIALNFDTAFSVIQPVFNQMIKQSSGKIILIGARPAIEHRGGKEMIAYALSKSLILKFTELLNAEGKDKGITASVLVPGTIDTPANRKAMPTADRTSWVSPEELAESMLYLISENGKSLRETVLKFYGNG